MKSPLFPQEKIPARDSKTRRPDTMLPQAWQGGTGDPEATCELELSVAALLVVQSAGAAKVSSPRIALDQSRGPFEAVGAIGATRAFADPGLVLCAGKEALRATHHA